MEMTTLVTGSIYASYAHKPNFITTPADNGIHIATAAGAELANYYTKCDNSSLTSHQQDVV
jgi:adenine/guanine phosphoribosyltransferase-like PRPP-binding protein